MIINQSHTYSNDTSESNMVPIRSLYKRRWITTVNGGYRVLSFDLKDVLGDFATCDDATAFIDHIQPNIPDGMGGLTTITAAAGAAAVALALGLFLKSRR